MYCLDTVGTTKFVLTERSNVLCPLFGVSFKRGSTVVSLSYNNSACIYNIILLLIVMEEKDGRPADTVEISMFIFQLRLTIDTKKTHKFEYYECKDECMHVYVHMYMHTVCMYVCMYVEDICN